MKKFCLSFIFIMLLCTGCCDSTYYQKEIGNKFSTICIDGIEYIIKQDGYAGYMSPHLQADMFDKPRVVRCSVK